MKNGLALHLLYLQLVLNTVLQNSAKYTAQYRPDRTLPLARTCKYNTSVNVLILNNLMWFLWYIYIFQGSCGTSTASVNTHLQLCTDSKVLHCDSAFGTYICPSPLQATLLFKADLHKINCLQCCLLNHGIDTAQLFSTVADRSMKARLEKKKQCF